MHSRDVRRAFTHPFYELTTCIRLVLLPLATGPLATMSLSLMRCDIASLQGRVDQLEELNKQLTEERDQFLERYYRLVTQFELMGGSFDRARAGITDSIGYLRGRPEKRELHEIPALPLAKSLGNGDGNGLENGKGLENGIAKLAAAIEDERRREENKNS